MSVERLLEEDIDSLEKYERLIKQLEKLIDSDKIEQIQVILAKKDALLKDFPKSFDLAKFQEIGKKEKEQLSVLIEKVEQLTEREKQCMAKAVNKKKEIASRLRELKNGKKILSGYHSPKTNDKSRFKDLKT